MTPSDLILLVILISSLSFVLSFVPGFVLGFSAGRSGDYDLEDTELLDALDEHQIDLDIFTGRDTDLPDWRCYHPQNYNSYDERHAPTAHTARDAIRQFLQKNSDSDHRAV